MIKQTDREKILQHVSRDEVAQLTKELVDIPSPTGAERQIGEFILSWYSRHGIRPIRQEIDPSRINAVGLIEGRGDGLSLMINGHMDTSFTGTDEDLWDQNGVKSALGSSSDWAAVRIVN